MSVTNGGCRCSFVSASRWCTRSYCGRPRLRSRVSLSVCLLHFPIWEIYFFGQPRNVHGKPCVTAFGRCSRIDHCKILARHASRIDHCVQDRSRSSKLHTATTSKHTVAPRGCGGRRGERPHPSRTWPRWLPSGRASHRHVLRPHRPPLVVYSINCVRTWLVAVATTRC